jgi:hypothetical protein
MRTHALKLLSSWVLLVSFVVSSVVSARSASSSLCVLYAISKLETLDEVTYDCRSHLGYICGVIPTPEDFSVPCLEVEAFEMVL